MRRAGRSSALIEAIVAVAAAFAVYCASPVSKGRAQSGGNAASLPVTSSSSPQGALVVLDRVVAVINGDVILESDIQEEMRFAGLQPGHTNPGVNTPQRALQRLIDRDLILQQMKLVPTGAAPPTPEQVDGQLLELRKQIPECAEYHCQTDAGWQAFLSAHGLTPADVKSRWRQRMSILSFIQSRFGAGVRVSHAETEEYYNKIFVPGFTKRNLKPPDFQSVADRIQEILLEQKVNGFLQDWLQSLKDEGNVSILSSAYSSVGTPEANDQDSAKDLEGKP